MPTNAISPPAAPAPAKASANDAHKAPADASPFATILASVNNPPAQAAPPDDDNSDANSAPAQDSSGAQTASASTTTDDNSSVDATDGQTPVSGKPGAKDAKDAKDTKSANDNDGQLALQGTALPDPNIIAQAQTTLMTAQAPAPAAAQTAAAANDDDDATIEETGAVNGAGKTSAKSAPPAKPDALIAANDAPDPADAAGQSPAAAAQAAIKGAGNKGDNTDAKAQDAKAQDTKTQDTKAADADKAAAKIADSKPTQTETQSQPQATSSSSGPANSTATPAISHAMPVQTASASTDVSAQVQVAPQSPTPDVNGLAVEIAARSQSGSKQFQIRLDPPELGRVDVRLSIDATGKAEAHLTADRPETLSLLQKDSSTLTQALRNSGLDVSQGGLNFSLRGQNGQAGNGQDGQGRASGSNLAASRVLDAAQNTSSINFTGGTGRLDIHV